MEDVPLDDTRDMDDDPVTALEHSIGSSNNSDVTEPVVNDEEDVDEQVSLLEHNNDNNNDTHIPVVNAPELDDVQRAMLHEAAFNTYQSVVTSCTRRFQHLVQTFDADDTWVPLPYKQQDLETLELHRKVEHTSSGGDGGGNVQHIYSYVRGRLELPGDNAATLFTDVWPRTRLSWDKADVKDVRLIERFTPDLCVVQIQRHDDGRELRRAGGTLVLVWKTYLPTSRAWSVLLYTLDCHHALSNRVPRTPLSQQRHMWTMAYIADNLDDGGACTIDVIAYHQYAPSTWATWSGYVFGRFYSHPEEALRQRMHFLEQIFKQWFTHFVPGVAYGVDTPSVPQMHGPIDDDDSKAEVDK